MPTHHDPNVSSPSTTWKHTRVRIASPAAGPWAGVAKRHRWYHLAPWPRRQKITITVRSRGGPECWYEVEARGSKGRIEGFHCLHDLMTLIYNDGPTREQ